MRGESESESERPNECELGFESIALSLLHCPRKLQLSDKTQRIRARERERESEREGIPCLRGRQKPFRFSKQTSLI
jgi:hypothetical protein